MVRVESIEGSMKRIHAILLGVGVSWLAVVLWIVFSNVILRETRLGPVAQRLDALPPAIGTPIFFLIWAILLGGWVPLVVLGLRPIVRK
jgi:hypothetical protein